MSTPAFAPSAFLGAGVRAAATTAPRTARPSTMMAKKEKSKDKAPKKKAAAPGKIGRPAAAAPAAAVPVARAAPAAAAAPVEPNPVPGSSPTRPVRAQAGSVRNQTDFETLRAGLQDGFVSSTQGGDVGVSGAEAVRRLLGNAHVYESEWAGELGAIAGRKDMTGDMRECVREVAMSDAFTSRFLEKAGTVRFVEVCFKLLLGRGPVNKKEVSDKIVMLADGNVSYADFVDSFVGCEEYDERFGRMLLPEFVTPGGLYGNGMVGFMSNMRVQATTRGGNTDATPTGSMSFPVVAGGEPAASEFVTASYAVPQYKPFKVQLLHTSVLSTDYSASLNCSPAAANWAGCTERPHGPENGAWVDGWKPEAINSWKAGWAPAGKSKYV